MSDTREQKILTDEHREKIRKLVYAPQKDLGRGLMVQFVSTRDAARSLLASEQALREEVELLSKGKESAERLMFQHSDEALLLRGKLNQAIEVLKWIADKGYGAQQKLARDFLSSLNKEETP